jgi:hypothetical protein
MDDATIRTSRLTTGDLVPTFKSWFALISILVFFILVGLSAHKPFHLDSIDFVAAAKATAKSGVPIYYRGEENQTASGLYHPPLYIYSLAAWFRVFDSGASATRYFGAICAILQGLLVMMMAARLLGRATAKKLVPFFWPFFLLNPYVLAVSGITDIDSTLYGPLLLGFLYSVLGCRWENGVEKSRPASLGELAACAGWLMLAFWAKLTTVLLLLPFLYLLLWRPKQAIRAFFEGTGIVLCGGLLFLSSYWIYGWLTHMDINYTYAFLVYSLKARGAAGPGLMNKWLHFSETFRYNLEFNLRWEGILLWVLFFVGFATSVRDLVKEKSLQKFQLVLLESLVLSTVIYYWGKVLPFGSCPQKYAYVFWGLLFLPLSLGVREISQKGLFGVSIVLVAATFALGAFWLKDGLMFGAPVFLRFNTLWGVTGGLTFVALLASWFLRRGHSDLARVAFYLLLLAQGGMNAGVALAMARTDYSIDYNYGQRGMREAADYLREHVRTGERISSMKDIGFLVELPYYENYAALFLVEERNRLVDRLRRGEIRYAVFTARIGEDRLNFFPELQAQVQSVSRLVAEKGDYLIFESKGPKSEE